MTMILEITIASDNLFPTTFILTLHLVLFVIQTISRLPDGEEICFRNGDSSIKVTKRLTLLVDFVARCF
jgi:hypothetical protein